MAKARKRGKVGTRRKRHAGKRKKSRKKKGGHIPLAILKRRHAKLGNIIKKRKS